MITKIPSRFLEEPGGHLLLDLDMTILDCGPYFAKISLHSSDYLIGKTLYDAFPSPEKSGKNKTSTTIKASFDRAISSRTPDKLVDCPINLKHPFEMGGEWEQRWWTITHVPLLENGQVVAVVQRVEDRTQEVRTYHMIRNQRISNYVLYVMCILLIGLITLAYGTVSNKVNSQNKKTCQIQARALPAQRELTRSMRDIYLLLAVPRSNKLPPPPRHEVRIIQDLESHLKLYIQFVNSQPITRNCR